MLDQARLYAEYAETVYIRGEVGTGKSALGQYVHAIGPRRARAFVYEVDRTGVKNVESFVAGME